VGLFEKIFRRPRSDGSAGYFALLNGYAPAYSTRSGGVYEMELTRAAIHAFASACSKLQPELIGSAKRRLEPVLTHMPNDFMDTPKFLYRIATMLLVNNTAFITPIEDEGGQLCGYYPALPQNAEIVDVKGEPYLRYTFGSGQRVAVELSRVGLLTRYQYSDDIFGETNAALRPTMDQIHAQGEAVKAAIRNGANIRFIGRIGNMIKPEDQERARRKFAEDNLSSENKTGLLIYDDKFSDMKQVISKPFTADTAQMEQIRRNVFYYFQTNERIITNDFNEEQWAAYYNGAVEPFAIQLSAALTNMTFTARERSRGNQVMLTSNRLQYASAATKLQYSTQLIDRGLITPNEARAVWNMPPIEGGDVPIVRKEYTPRELLGKEESDSQ
jgi:phage portal protein BeeE